jgi:hypothetical protein
MEITYQFVQGIFIKVLKNPIFDWSILIAKAVAIVVLILHYFKLYYSSFNDSQKSIKTYDLIRPLIYIVLLAFYTTFLDGLDQVTGAVESSFTKYTTEKMTKKVDDKLKESESTQSSTTPPPPTQAEQQTAKATSNIWAYLSNPEIVIVKILNFFVYLIDSLLFGFSLISRAAFLFILRFLAPFAIVASIFDQYKKYFWNWLKIYGIVFLSVYVFFAINEFSDAFLDALYDYKMNSVLPTMMDPFSTMATFLMLCMVLVKTFLYFKSVKLMYQVYSSNA